MGTVNPGRWIMWDIERYINDVVDISDQLSAYLKIVDTTGKWMPSSYEHNITKEEVVDAIGFTPYDSLNPKGYITEDSIYVRSVNSKDGHVVINTSDISEGTNLYFTNSRSRSSISLTTTGSTGASTYNSSTGVLNIPQYTTSINLRNRSGSLSTSPVFFVDTFSVSTSTPTIDLSSFISAAGKSSCKIVSAVAYRSGASTSNSPNVTITAMTSTAVSLILNQTNTATVTILGISVLSGLPTILTPDPTNVKVLISAYFY